MLKKILAGIIIGLFCITGSASALTIGMDDLVTEYAPNMYGMELDITNQPDGTGDWLAGFNITGFGESESELEAALSNFIMPTGWNYDISDNTLNFSADAGYLANPGDSLSFDFLMADNYQNLVATGYSNFGELSNSVDVNGAAPVPEPATIILLGTGLVGLIGAKKAKRKRPD